MSNFKVHTIESAPEKSKSQLEHSKKAYGFVPNLHAVLAESPGLLEAYKSVGDHFIASSLDKDEITVVWQTINVEHECHYCVPAHAAVAKGMKVDDALTHALRNKTAMPTEKLQALHDMTLAIVRNRGRITEAEKKAFFAAGYTNRQLFDILIGVSQKVISNYANHIAETPIDPAFQRFV